MHVVFCIDDNPRFLMLLKVAVRSLRQCMGNDIPCLCVYAGDNAEILESLANENIPVARYTPLLSKEVIPKQFHGCIGCFLKLELSLVPELKDDDFILYCDADVLFQRSITELMAERPAYMAMAREYTAPFYHEHEQLRYIWRQSEYTVPMPFPIWTFSSGVVVFNAQRLRKYDYIHNFLAFCEQNVDKIGNLDQSLLNYFFGKHIHLLPEKWNRPPYQADAEKHGSIIHFHGPKPWELLRPDWKDLRINCYEALRQKWISYLNPAELELLNEWIAEDERVYGSAK